MNEETLAQLNKNLVTFIRLYDIKQKHLERTIKQSLARAVRETGEANYIISNAIFSLVNTLDRITIKPQPTLFHRFVRRIWWKSG